MRSHPHRSPRLEALFAYARQLWTQRPDLQAAHGTVESLSYWTWLLAKGWYEHPEIRAHLPIPPPELTGRVLGAYDADQYHHSSLSDAHHLVTQLAAAGLDLNKPAAILDFGCGCGRLLRVLARFADTLTFYGVDIDADAIRWCQTHLDFAECTVSLPTPPLAFKAQQFAAVYCWSIFSHLPEPLHFDWLADLHRVLVPGGLLFLTTQGRTCIERWLAADVDELPFPTPTQLRADLPQLERTGFLYYPYEQPMASMPQADRDRGLYGMTYILEPYIRQNWLERFELVRFAPAPQRWQDYVVLRRR